MTGKHKKHVNVLLDISKTCLDEIEDNENRDNKIKDKVELLRKNNIITEKISDYLCYNSIVKLSDLI
tara:strand:- start:144 stop:344 length:201 start_codon:yes stop_codon:yes gene_type:complete